MLYHEKYHGSMQPRCPLTTSQHVAACLWTRQLRRVWAERVLFRVIFIYLTTSIAKNMEIKRWISCCVRVSGSDDRSATDTMATHQHITCHYFRISQVTLSLSFMMFTCIAHHILTILYQASPIAFWNESILMLMLDTTLISCLVHNASWYELMIMTNDKSQCRGYFVFAWSLRWPVMSCADHIPWVIGKSLTHLAHWNGCLKFLFSNLTSESSMVAWMFGRSPCLEGQLNMQKRRLTVLCWELILM